MSDERDVLLQKRRLLQEQIKRDRQRQQIASELTVLDDAGVSYELVWPEAVNALWSARYFPQLTTRIDWSAVPGARCIEWQDEVQRNDHFHQLLRHYAPEESTEFLVVWGDGDCPALRLCCADLCRHCDLILGAGFEVWVSAVSGHWLLECQAEGRLFVGEWPAFAAR